MRIRLKRKKLAMKIRCIKAPEMLEGKTDTTAKVNKQTKKTAKKV